jgi:hypothetical protein
MNYQVQMRKDGLVEKKFPAHYTLAEATNKAAVLEMTSNIKSLRVFIQDQNTGQVFTVDEALSILEANGDR